jgi:pyridoxine 5-phosphate synthase
VISLSININKVATLRNSRGGTIPSVLDAVRVCLKAGAPAITVHPRADARHITTTDVDEVAALLADEGKNVELNIEGDPRPDLLAMVRRVKPAQCTLVPVRPGELTSEAGWSPDASVELMRDIVRDLQQTGVRVSLFVNPDERAIDWAARTGADRVELYTEPFARAFERGEGQASFERYAAAAQAAHARGLGVNAGHDLDLENLVLFRRLPHLAEVSIGHALVSHALFVGLERSVRDYLAVLL